MANIKLTIEEAEFVEKCNKAAEAANNLREALKNLNVEISTSKINGSELMEALSNYSKTPQ